VKLKKVRRLYGLWIAAESLPNGWILSNDLCPKAMKSPRDKIRTKLKKQQINAIPKHLAGIHHMKMIPAKCPKTGILSAY